MGARTKVEAVADAVAETCIALRVRRLSRQVTRIYDDAMRPHGLTIAQYSMLSALIGGGPMSATELGEQLDLEKSTVSRNLGRMAARGWVVSRRTTGRTSDLHVRDEGRKLFERAHPAWEEAQKVAREMMFASAMRR